MHTFLYVSLCVCVCVDSQGAQIGACTSTSVDRSLITPICLSFGVMASINHKVFSEEICHWGPSLPLSSSSCSLVPAPSPPLQPSPPSPSRPPPILLSLNLSHHIPPLVLLGPRRLRLFLLLHPVESSATLERHSVALESATLWLSPPSLRLPDVREGIVGQFEPKRARLFKRSVHVWFAGGLFFFLQGPAEGVCVCVHACARGLHATSRQWRRVFITVLGYFGEGRLARGFKSLTLLQPRLFFPTEHVVVLVLSPSHTNTRSL